MSHIALIDCRTSPPTDDPKVIRHRQLITEAVALDFANGVPVLMMDENEIRHLDPAELKRGDPANHETLARYRKLKKRGLPVILVASDQHFPMVSMMCALLPGQSPEESFS